MTAPQRFTVGDTLDFTVEVDEYLPADGWSFSMVLVPRFTSPTQAPITLTATTSGTLYLIQYGPSTTSGWKAGQYGWWSYVSKSGARHVLEGTQFEGELQMLPDPTALTQGTDSRSQAQKAVDDLLAALATFTATNGLVKSYTIGERTMTYKDRSEISQELQFWQSQLAREKRATALAAGLKDPHFAFARLDRV